MINSVSDNWSLTVTFVGGMLRLTPFASKRSAMVKPRSAITESPGSSKSSKPDFSNSSLSEMLPPCNLEINEIAPDGVMHTNALRVLWFLYDEKVNCCACGLDGD